MTKIKVYAEKVDTRYNVVTDDVLYLGEIDADTLAEAFIKTLRLYNKNAQRHIDSPMFKYRGTVYSCSYYGEKSKTGRGYTRYWSLDIMRMAWPPKGHWDDRKIQRGYVLMIPKSKVNDRNWLKYIE